MFLSIKPFTQSALLTWCTTFHSSTDKKLATAQDRQTMQNSDENQYCHPYIAWQKILLCCYCTNKSLDVCIFARFEVNCEVMLLRSFTIFKLMMSRHREELRGALGHGLFCLCINPSLAKPFDGLAFLTNNNHNVTLILRWSSTSCSKRNADWILSFNCARRYFVKSKFGYWHPLICSYEFIYIHLVDFDLFNRHNQWYSRGQHYTALRFPLLLVFIENCLVNNCLIMITAKQTFSCLC